MKKIKIGMFTDAFFPMTDGVGMVVHNYALRLNKIAEVIVFCPKYKKDFDDAKLPYKVVRCKSVKMPILDYSLPTPKIDRSFKKELDQYDFFLENSLNEIYHHLSPYKILVFLSSSYKLAMIKGKFDWFIFCSIKFLS